MISREYRGVAFAVLLFVLVQLGALALVPTFFDRGYQPVENPQDPTNSLLYVGAILVATALLLAAFKYDLDALVRLLIVGVSGWLAWFVFAAIVPGIVAAALAVAVAGALLAYPEWYVIDAAGVLMGAGAAGLFGISFGLLPALILLAVLAIYDAISVYGTEHMLDLAEGVMDLKIPVVLVVPTTLSYSLLDDDFSDAAGVHDGEAASNAADLEGEAAPDAAERDGVAASTSADPTDRSESVETGNPLDADGSAGADGFDDSGDSESDAGDSLGDDGPRDVFFVGLGDAVIPAVLVASAAFFSPAGTFDVPIVAINLPALGAMVGTLAGLLVLLRWVMRGRAHAGLPLLNGGAIGGYLVGSLLAGVPLVEALGLGGFL